MLLDTIAKFFHSDSDLRLDTDKLKRIKEMWEIDIVSSEDDPLLPFKEKGVEIISEEISRGRKHGGGWRSTTKGRGGE